MAWPNKQQAIIWTNDDLLYWGIYASVDLIVFNWTDDSLNEYMQRILEIFTNRENEVRIALVSARIAP